MDWVLLAESLSAAGGGTRPYLQVYLFLFFTRRSATFLTHAGFMNVTKDLRGSSDAIPIVFILKDAISKILRFARNCSRYFSVLSFQRQRPARHLRRRNWRPCLLRPRASLRLRLLRLLSLRLCPLRLLRA